MDIEMINPWTQVKSYHGHFERSQTPGIKEVDYEDVKQVLKELKTYMKVPKDAVKNVRVFDVEDLLFFLENAVGVFKI